MDALYSFDIITTESRAFQRYASAKWLCRGKKEKGQDLNSDYLEETNGIQYTMTCRLVSRQLVQEIESN